jgi:hypothetical protein
VTAALGAVMTHIEARPDRADLHRPGADQKRSARVMGDVEERLALDQFEPALRRP